MTALADLFPPLGLTLTAGPLVMRGISDEILPELADLARRGIHDPGEMPFYVPWTDAPGPTSRATRRPTTGARAQSSRRASGVCIWPSSTTGSWSVSRASRRPTTW